MIALLVCLLFVAVPGQSSTSAPRVCAEWEPAIGVLVAWPFRLPDALLVDLARDVKLFVLAADEEAEKGALGELEKLGAAMGNVVVHQVSVGLPWTRDYGPHQVFTGRGELAFVDQRFAGYPYYRAEAVDGEGAWVFARDARDDDVTPELAAQLGRRRLELPFFLTGGNFLVDGHRRAFCSRAMLIENTPLGTEADFLGAVKDVLGTEEVVVLANTEERGIQHIDCWLKLLDEETLLVKRAPDDHPEHARVEANLARLRELETPYGRPYRILRIDCPPFREDDLAAYTNSLILNERVYVPLFGIPADEGALEAYRTALPGYAVKGYPYSGWQHFDALHCRTRAVFDPEMLRLAHGRVRDGAPAGAPIRVVLRIEDHGGEGLAPEELRLQWRRAGEERWRALPLEALEEPDTYGAAIPAQAEGAAVEYWLAAADRGGRRETLPRSAPRGAYSFRVGP